MAAGLLDAAERYVSELHSSFAGMLSQIEVETKESVALHGTCGEDSGSVTPLEGDDTNIEAHIQSLRTSIYIVVGTGEGHIDEGRTFLASIISETSATSAS